MAFFADMLLRRNWSLTVQHFLPGHFCGSKLTQNNSKKVGQLSKNYFYCRTNSCVMLCCAISSDCALLAARDGCGRGSADILSHRLQAPVAGIAAIPHHNHLTGGLSLLQVELLM